MDRSKRQTRSRSPETQNRPRRQRSPHHHRNRRSGDVAQAPRSLPYNSRNLSKRDFNLFKPMFALYLDIQKGKVMEDLDTVEVKGRWKSFVKKWNLGELAEGWYDPSTFQKAVASSSQPGLSSGAADSSRGTRGSHSDVNREHDSPPDRTNRPDPDSSGDELVGPALPGSEKGSRRSGPAIPSIEDLQIRREMQIDDDLERVEDIKFARKADRKQQKEAADEVNPRAEAGTRERQLEKKKEINDKMKSFRERSPGAIEVPDSELMGGGEGLSDFKRQKQDFERKKNEREVRKEEILRARAAEREERLSEYKQKEDKTMAMLKTLAKQNFG